MTNQTGKMRLLSLHRYFIWADRMRKHFDAAIDEKSKTQAYGGEADILEFTLYMSYWYAALYVVIEGWGELKLTAPEIDQYLTSPCVALLKRYRHGVFHFQAKYDDDRFVAFIAEGRETVPWVRGIHEAFGAYFLHEVPKLKALPVG
jgi:hypothetical protein